MQWYLDAGVDETIGDVPIDRFAAPPPAAVPPAAVPPAAVIGPPGAGAPSMPGAAAPARAAVPERGAGGGAVPAGRSPRAKSPPLHALLPEEKLVQQAVSLASSAGSLAELREGVASFEGCPLKRTATNLVFGRGNPSARIVLIGEAPGAEEDRQGLPFVGPSGRLLDRMLASIDLTPDDVFISNTVFWRPPGNRVPTSSETAACMPFLQRMLELIDPDVLVALGGPAAAALLGRAESVGKLRGRWFPYQSPGLSRPAATTVTFHPAYLLRSPGQKRLVWRDLLVIKKKLVELNIQHKQEP